MLNEKTLKPIKSILERIDDVEKACKENGGVVKALETKISQSAIMLYLMRIHQQFENLENNEDNILKLIPDTILNNIRKSRNIAAHDYDKLNFSIIEKIIRFDLPKIKDELTQILDKNKIQSLETLHKEIEYYEKNKNLFYQDAKIKQEKTILKIYNELKNKGEQIDEQSLKMIEVIQKSYSKL